MLSHLSFLSPAFNTVKDTDKIDIHKLRVVEGIAQTEMALYKLRQRGGSELQVVVASKEHPEYGGHVLKKAIKDKMRK